MPLSGALTPRRVWEVAEELVEHAAAEGKFETVRLLLEAGADKNSQSERRLDCSE